MKHFRKFLLLILSVISVCCIGMFASACGENPDELVVTVTYPDGKAVEKGSVEVQLCVVMKDGTIGSCYGTTLAVDENGKATFKTADLIAFADSLTDSTHKLHIGLNKVPEGYLGSDLPDEHDYETTVDIDAKYTVKIALAAKA